MPAPEVDIRRVAEAHVRLRMAVEVLTDEEVKRPSALPGWTVGHLLTHIARNADSHVRRTEAATRGEYVEQYEGGLEGRAAAIEDGAARSSTELIADVIGSAAKLDACWAGVPTHAWTVWSKDSSGTERRLLELPSRRWQEVEVHIVDLGTGATHRDWPDDFVASWLPRTHEKMLAHLPAASASWPDDPRDELAWLYGRLERDDLPVLPAWG
ncbi:MAG TPA: maleylpyruvate isomerase N-terminal domain-containing protein [Acidimicrobiales bacterium]|nr:maleylpyruvate isomerase N-terminal domain-containing protein [Acidimicrobiales bacterium]